MNFRRRKKTTASPELNLTSLVDVVLLLVLFFMVTAQFSVMPGINIDLPRVHDDTKASTQALERLEISISSSGDLSFEGRPTSMDNLALHLERTGANGEEVVILISADRNSSYNSVMQVMDVLKREGFRRVVFAATNEDKKE